MINSHWNSPTRSAPQDARFKLHWYLWSPTAAHQNQQFTPKMEELSQGAWVWRNQTMESGTWEMEHYSRFQEGFTGRALALTGATINGGYDQWKMEWSVETERLMENAQRIPQWTRYPNEIKFDLFFELCDLFLLCVLCVACVNPQQLGWT